MENIAKKELLKLKNETEIDILIKKKGEKIINPESRPKILCP